MTPVIRQRINQIRQGIVPEGYKKTKAGIVPASWETRNLSDVLRKQTKKNVDGAISNVLTNSATKGIINQTEYFDKQIANDENTAGYYIVHPGYFVYNPRISVTAPCGPFNKYYGKTTGIMSPLYTVYKYSAESLYYSEYLSDYFGSAYWHKYMNEIANYGARSDRMNVTSDDMNSLPLPYPPLAEQKKIAEILAAQDKIIELKEKLLEEKKKQKKYLMQQLLTGKKRLPGFSGEWTLFRISDCAELINNSINPAEHRDEYFELYSLPAFDSSKEPEIVKGDDINSNKFVVYSGLILFNKLNVRQKRVWLIQTTTKLLQLASTEFLPLKVKNADSEFLTYYLSSDQVANTFIRKSSGTSNSQQRILPDDLLKQTLLLPSMSEQKEIAHLLVNFDKEISCIEKIIDQEKQKKKALMQFLLTGIVRVNV